MGNGSYWIEFTRCVKDNAYFRVDGKKREVLMRYAAKVSLPFPPFRGLGIWTPHGTLVIGEEMTWIERSNALTTKLHYAVAHGDLEAEVAAYQEKGWEVLERREGR